MDAESEFDTGVPSEAIWKRDPQACGILPLDPTSQPQGTAVHRAGHDTTAGQPHRASLGERLANLLPGRRSRLSPELSRKIHELFRQMDVDDSGSVTRVEALAFFKGAFGKMSVDAMFNELDDDKSKDISAKEMTSFWAQVKRSGYTEEEIVEEIDMLLGGGAWVDWQDKRQTVLACQSRSGNLMMKSKAADVPDQPSIA